MAALKVPPASVAALPTSSVPALMSNGVATIVGPGDRQRSRSIFGDESVVKGCAERQVPVLGTISNIKLDVTRSLHVHEATVDARYATARAGGGDIEIVGATAPLKQVVATIEGERAAPVVEGPGLPC